MTQIGFVKLLIFTCLLAIIHSVLTVDNNLGLDPLIFQYNCKPGDYYDFNYGCLRCTRCERENFKTETPCSLHSNAVCSDCVDGHEKQLQGESIRCIRIQLSDKNDDLAHPGDDNDLNLDSSPSRSSHNSTVNQTSLERANDISNLDAVNVPVPSSDISFMVEYKGTIAIIALVVITAAILVVLIVSLFRSGNTAHTTVSANKCGNFSVTINGNNRFNNEQPRRGPKTWDSSRRRSRKSSTSTGAEPDESLLDNVSSNSVPSVSGYHTQTAPSPIPSNHRQGGVIDADHKQVWDNMEPPLNQLR